MALLLSLRSAERNDIVVYMFHFFFAGIPNSAVEVFLGKEVGRRDVLSLRH